jgi:hypothetical protein
LARTEEELPESSMHLPSKPWDTVYVVGPGGELDESVGEGLEPLCGLESRLSVRRGAFVAVPFVPGNVAVADATQESGFVKARVRVCHAGVVFAALPDVALSTPAWVQSTVQERFTFTPLWLDAAFSSIDCGASTDAPAIVQEIGVPEPVHEVTLPACAVPDITVRATNVPAPSRPAAPVATPIRVRLRIVQMPPLIVSSPTSDLITFE